MIRAFVLVLVAGCAGTEPGGGATGDAAPGGGDGNTTNDIDLGADCRTLRLRAERDNSGNGRVYTVTLRVRDASGNEASRSLRVIVPRNKGSGPGVDDGPRVTVTGSCP